MVTINTKKLFEMWRGYRINNKYDLKNHIENLSILFTFHSGNIENSSVKYYDVKEIFDKGQVIKYTGDLITLYEIDNQKKALSYMFECFEKRIPISIELIKKLHFYLCDGTYDERRYNHNNEQPGQFKKHYYVAGINQVGTRPENVNDQMNELIRNINDFGDVNDDNVLIRGSYLHNCIETIHPFSDGNGRVGRIIMNYFFILNNYPPIIIYSEDKKDYYAALEISDKENNLAAMSKFLEYELQKTWNKTLNNKN
ncbi:MAG: Fic family protein [Thomasclavelia sp.]|nr:Fic family protein [Thomasclavelia sp.]